jgi:N-acetylglucosaminyldiphosphoundecaprenol N-acetyl-beta-D-mannosaminyltransferase
MESIALNGFAMNERVKMFGIDFDAFTMSQTVSRLLQWSAEPEYRCRYVVTPNVDHVVKLQTDTAFREAYQDASLVTVDGKPVLWASRLLGKRLPALVTGSDTCPALFDAAKAKLELRVFLLGAAEGVAVRAADTISKRWPWVKIVGCFSPPMGFNALSADNVAVLEMINLVKPDILIVGLGAPKQEIWIHAMQHQLQVKVALCVGATIDFLAGEKARAPKLMRVLGLEWLHRMLSEPKRLAGRYWHDAKVFPKLVLREITSK